MDELPLSSFAIDFTEMVVFSPNPNPKRKTLYSEERRKKFSLYQKFNSLCHLSGRVGDGKT